MNMTPEEYNELTKQSSPRSPFIKDFLLAFTIGGLICALGQAIMMASPALEFKSEGLVLGLAAKMFVIAGPVIVYGTSASIVYGLIIYLFGLY